MRKTFLLLIAVATLSFAVHPDSGHPFKVKHKGALMNIMHEGDLSAKADLSKFSKKGHFYALGAVENLKGEILVLDSKPFVSSVVNKELSISNTFDHKATLLVYCTVNHWNPIPVPENVRSYEELEKLVEAEAAKAGLDTEKPFPFLLEGNVESFDWHVIDWKDGDTEHSHEKHVNSGLHGSMEQKEVQILGFFSKHHQRVFTHHSTFMHLHVKTTDDQMAGHLDGLTLGKGMTLKLPAMN